MASLAAACVLIAQPANGEAAYPPPVGPVTRTAERCIIFIANGKPYNGVLRPGQQLKLKGLSKCARSSEQAIQGILRSSPIVLTTFNALEDGSYLSPTFKVPMVAPGAHLVIAQTRDSALSRSVQVVVPASVLGTTTTRQSGGGVLPLTGSQIMLLLLIALALVATGLLLRRLARDRELAFAAGGRSGRRNGPLLLPPPEVPFIDTSHFVPFRPRPRTPTEDRDVPPAERRPSS